MTSLGRTLQPNSRPARLLQGVSIAGVVILVINWWILRDDASAWRLDPLKSGFKLAYATLLLASNSTTPDSDAYLLSTRILNYQLLHSSSTGGSKSITFLVLVTPDVPVWKRDRLEREGATIVVVEKLDLKWMTPLTERWRDVMVKLRLFQLTDYDRILFLDADTFLLKPLEKIFSDPAVTLLKTLTNVPTKPDEASLPSSYLFATLPEVRNIIHSYPPLTLPYFNAGFFILQPSLQLFAYYASLLILEGRFDSTYPEQNLLNYAHRENGNMPWSRLRHEWNINLPNANDVQSGVRSVHSKLWTKGSVLEPTMPELRRRWKEVRDEMEEFYGNRR